MCSANPPPKAVAGSTSGGTNMWSGPLPQTHSSGTPTGSPIGNPILNSYMSTANQAGLAERDQAVTDWNTRYGAFPYAPPGYRAPDPPPVARPTPPPTPPPTSAGGQASGLVADKYPNAIKPTGVLGEANKPGGTLVVPAPGGNGVVGGAGGNGMEVPGLPMAKSESVDASLPIAQSSAPAVGKTTIAAPVFAPGMAPPQAGAVNVANALMRRYKPDWWY